MLKPFTISCPGVSRGTGFPSLSTICIWVWGNGLPTTLVISGAPGVVVVTTPPVSFVPKVTITDVLSLFLISCSKSVVAKFPGEDTTKAFLSVLKDFFWFSMSSNKTLYSLGWATMAVQYSLDSELITFSLSNNSDPHTSLTL